MEEPSKTQPFFQVHLTTGETLAFDLDKHRKYQAWYDRLELEYWVKMGWYPAHNLWSKLPLSGPWYEA